MYIIGEFYYDKGRINEDEPAAKAISALQARGISSDDLDVFSAEPVEFASGILERRSHMSLIAVIGGIAAFLSAIGFVYYAQHAYPLVTGGMPIFSAWATSVIFYELTMLGSVAVTFLWFLYESGILGRRHSAPVPQAVPGSIFVRVRCEDRQAAEAHHCLSRAGAQNIETSGQSSRTRMGKADEN